MRNYIAMSKHAIDSLSGKGKNEADPSFATSFHTGLAKNLINVKKETGNADVLAINKMFESDLLKGEIKVIMPEMGLPIFKYAMHGTDDVMGMKDVSKSVASLAPFSILMRFFLQENSALFFEDPEINLDSEQQKSLADIMLRLADANVPLVVATESAVLLEQVGNAVGSSKLANGDNLNALHAENVKVFSFQKQSDNSGSVVENVPFDFTNGFLTDNAAQSAGNESGHDR